MELLIIAKFCRQIPELVKQPCRLFRMFAKSFYAGRPIAKFLTKSSSHGKQI